MDFWHAELPFLAMALPLSFSIEQKNSFCNKENLLNARINFTLEILFFHFILQCLMFLSSELEVEGRTENVHWER